MKRFLIFSILFPLIAVVVFVAHEPRLPELAVLFRFTGITYLVAMIPAWLSALADWSLSSKPIYLRLAAVAIAGAILAVLTQLFFGERGDYVLVVLMGAIPAAACCLLSHRLA
jgi:hypothetical protein